MSGMKIRYHIQDKQEYKDEIKKIIMEEVKNETDINLNNLNKIINDAVKIAAEQEPPIKMDPERQKNAVGEIKKDERFKNEIKEVMEKLLKAQQEEEDTERLAKEEEDKAAAEEEKKLLEEAMKYFDNDVKQENIADEFISIEEKEGVQEAEGGKKPAKKPKRKVNKTKRAKKSNKKKRKPKRKTLRKIKKIIFR